MADGREQDRVAVRRRLRHVVGCDDARRAGLVLHHHRLAEQLAELRRDEPRVRIDRAARRIADDEADRLRRERLRGRERRTRMRRRARRRRPAGGGGVDPERRCSIISYLDVVAAAGLRLK